MRRTWSHADYVVTNGSPVDSGPPRLEDESREHLSQRGRLGAQRAGFMRWSRNRSAKVPCPHCGEPKLESNLDKHKEVCRGRKTRAVNNKCQRVLADGQPCGRLKASWAEECFRCAGGFKDPALEHLNHLGPGFEPEPNEEEGEMDE